MVSKKDLKEILKTYKSAIFTHILVYIIYGNSYYKYSIYFDELADWFTNICAVTVNTKSKKLKYQQYQKYLFGEFGNTVTDIRINIDYFYFKYVEELHEYPMFNYESSDLILRTRQAVDSIIKVFCKLFAETSSQTIIKSEVQSELHKILDAYS